MQIATTNSIPPDNVSKETALPDLEQVLAILNTSQLEVKARVLKVVISKLKAKRSHVSTNRNTGAVMITKTDDHTTQLAAARLLTEVLPGFAASRFQPASDKGAGVVNLIFPTWKSQPSIDAVIEVTTGADTGDVMPDVPSPPSLSPTPPDPGPYGDGSYDDD